MKKLLFFFLIILSLVIFLGSNFNNNSNLYAENGNIINIHVFYSQDCDTCLRVLEKIKNLIAEKYPNLQLKTYEITNNDNNLHMLFYLLDSYNNKKYDYKVPIIFLGKHVLIGEEDIEKNFDNILQNLKQDDNLNYPEKIIKEYLEKNNSNVEKNYITFPAIIVAAIADSINPCAIGVIIFLLTALILAKDKRYALISGLVYILTIFVIYLLIGFGFIYFTRNIHIPYQFFIVVGTILIILGLLSIKDFFWYGKGISLGIPKPIKTFVVKNINKATIISIIIVGIVISIFEATCSGAVYIGVLSLISNQGLNLKLFSLLILYNFIFILPLLIILIVFYFGIPVKKLQRLLIQKKRKLYRLILGIILIFLGVYLIFWI